MIFYFRNSVYNICKFIVNKFNLFCVLFISSLIFSNFSYAVTKADSEKSQIATEIFNKYQSVARSLGNLSFNTKGRDTSKMTVSLAGSFYKIRYMPTPTLDISIDYNKQDDQIIAISLKSDTLNTTEKANLYRNNFLIISKLIDNKIGLSDFNKIYTALDLDKVNTEPRYLKNYINNDYLYSVDAYSRQTKFFTLRIRKSNKSDKEDMDLSKSVNILYSDTTTKLGFKTKNIYPEISRVSLNTKNLFFFISKDTSMNLLVKIGFIKDIPISGTVTYENPISNANKKEDFTQGVLTLLLLTDNKLSINDAKELINKLGLDEALNNKDYFKTFADEINVYTLGYNNNKLFLSVNPRTPEYDKIASIETLTQNLYNNATSDLGLTGKVKSLTAQDLSTKLLNAQNSVLFRPIPTMSFRIYYNNATNDVIRINIVLPKVFVDRNLELQKNNALIAIKMLNPSISKQDAENIYNYLKNTYGATETRIIGNFRYKRCTYKDETLVFSKYDAKEDYSENTPLTKDGNPNVAAYNPNLIYEPDTVVDESGKKTLIVKPQPLCY